MRVAISGATTAVGRLLVKGLLENSADITILGRSEARCKTLFPTGVKFHYFNFSDGANSPLESVRLDAVIHLAAVTPTGNPRRVDYLGNVFAATKIARLASASGAAHVLYSSTLSILPNKLSTVSENTIPLPANPYALSKYVAEKILQSKLGKDRLIGVRLPGIVTGEDGGGFINRLIKEISKEEEINLRSPFESGNRFLPAQEVANFFMHLLYRKNVRGAVFPIGSSGSILAHELISLIGSHVGKVPRVSYRSQKKRERIVDIRFAERTYGYSFPETKVCLAAFLAGEQENVLHRNGGEGHE